MQLAPTDQKVTPCPSHSLVIARTQSFNFGLHQTSYENVFFSGKVFAPALDIILPATHHTSFPGHRANCVAMETACQIRGQAARLVKSLRYANLHARLHIKAMSAMSCHSKRLVPLLANVSCSARKRGLYHDAQMRMSATTPPDTCVCLIILSYCHSEDGVSMLLSNVAIHLPDYTVSQPINTHNRLRFKLMEFD